MVSLFTSIGAMLCATIVLNMDQEHEITVSRRPHGNCLWCCSLDVQRDVQYLLFTRSQPDQGIVLAHEDPGTAAIQGGADPAKPTVIFLHGFGERAYSFSSMGIKNAYLETGDYNVILVDWNALASAPWYTAAVRNTRLVGRLLANFLLQLDRPQFLPLANIHVIGFSLGAETAGFAGKAMPPNRRIPRITGLDPAFPLYFGGRSFHLASGDATFVDVIHTNAGILGYPTPIGDVDFYPNGGKLFQPGCLRENIHSGYFGCSHVRAWQYYVESIKNPYGFPATKCNRWTGFLAPCKFRTSNYMGIQANPRYNGKFYLETNAKPPFSQTTS